MRIDTSSRTTDDPCLNCGTRSAACCTLWRFGATCCDGCTCTSWGSNSASSSEVQE